jgi:anthranilate/para-aminobenzoate synthase component II
MAAQINDIRFYTPLSGKPPKMPFADYVLIVGTQQDGSIHTPLLEALKKEFPELKTVEVPFYDFSSDFIENLNHQPKAVILSSNWVDYAKVPIFEYNGLFDFIRNSDIPTLGIAGGMHLQYMTYCTSYVRRIGYDVNDEMELAEMRKKEKNFVRQKDSPLFQGVASKFTAVELSKWEVLEEISEVIEYEILADFDYPMVVKNKLKEMYGVQFIPEIGASFNMAQNVLQNFVKLALDIHEA